MRRFARFIKNFMEKKKLKKRSEDRSELVTLIKERHRVITEKLVGILEGEASASYDKPNFPTHTEHIAAANTILKLDIARFFTEEQIKAIEEAAELG